jgi:hypothetical protein
MPTSFLRELPKTAARISSALLVFALSAVTACGGISNGDTPPNSGTLTGTVSNTTFTVGTALGAIIPESATVSCEDEPDASPVCSSSSSGQAVAIGITNRPGLTCSKSFLEYANLDVLDLYVGAPSGTVTTGTHPIGPIAASGAGASALFSTSDSACTGNIATQATAGTITLTEVSSTRVTGSYSVTFGAQGSFSGSFDVALCDFLDAGATPESADAGLPACVQ